MNEETSLWIKRAKSDLKKAKDNIGIKHYDLVSFLCQQSAEKSLKAVLIEKTNNFPRIHDLVKLGRLVNIDEILLKECEKLISAYIEARYPDTPDRKFTKLESVKDIKSAEIILKWAKKQI